MTATTTTPIQAAAENFSNEVEQTTSVLRQLFDPLVQSLPHLVFALIFLLIGYFAYRLFMRILRHALDRSKLDRIAVSFLTSILRICFIVLLGVIALSIVGVPMTSIVAVIASAGVAVALALKDSLSNLAGGFIILFTKPLKEQDTVEVDKVIGKVEAISILYTSIVTPDNQVVRIPNSVVANTKITNYTDKPLRRCDLHFSISYKSDIAQARAVILSALADVPETVNDPPAVVYVDDHADSAVSLRVEVWTQSRDYFPCRYHAIEAVKLAFDSSGIEIPFPQLDVHLDGQTPGGKPL